MKHLLLTPKYFTVIPKEKWIKTNSKSKWRQRWENSRANCCRYYWGNVSSNEAEASINSCTKNEVFHHKFLQYVCPNPQESAYLITFTEEICNGKLHFLCNSIYEELVHWKKNSLRYHQEHQKKVTKMRYLGFLGWKFHH